MNEDLIQKFGFSEMYEWDKPVDQSMRLGRFVTFSKTAPGKITFVKNVNDEVLGITTINSIVDSDNPSEWKYKNLCNEVGDIYLRREKLAVGQKMYDQVLEMNYIQTRPYEHFIPITNKYFNPEAKYIKRSARQEWVRVNLMGKVIVKDDGKCKAGDYCMPYVGKIIAMQGSAVPASKNAKVKYYVLERLSENTILILNK